MIPNRADSRCCAMWTLPRSAGGFSAFVVEARRLRLEQILCTDKIELVDPADLLPVVGVYGQMGYRVLRASAATGQGIDRLQRLLAGNESAVAGQSGVGKSSLPNP